MTKDWSVPFDLSMVGREDIIVHTPHFSDAEALKDMLESLGIKVWDMAGALEYDEDETAYCVFSNGHVEFAGRSFYDNNKPWSNFRRYTFMPIELDDINVPDSSMGLF